MSVAILGAGKHAREVYGSLNAEDRRKIKCFINEALDVESEERLLGTPLRVYKRVPHDIQALMCGVGRPSIKKSFDERYTKRFMSCMHPRAIVLESHQFVLEEGVYVGATTLSVDIFIDRLTSINSNCLISHGCRIGKYCHISGGTVLAGDVVFEDEVYVGVGAKFLPKVKIGRGAVIGAGAVVTKDVPERAVIVGVPGKIQRILQEGEKFRL